MFKQLIELTDVERYYLISWFQKNGRVFKEEYYMSRTFDFGRSFYVVYSENIIGTVGIVSAEILTKGEMFASEIYNVSTKDIVGIIEDAVNRYRCSNILIGLKDSQTVPTGYTFEHKSLQLKYIGEKVQQELDIIPLDINNAELFTKIHNTCFEGVQNSGTFTLKDVYDLIKSSEGYIVYDGVAIGIILLDNNVIEAVGILPEYRRKGYGRQSLYKAIELIKEEVKLIVMSNNTSALNLYLENGFLIEKELKSWYRRP